MIVVAADIIIAALVARLGGEVTLSPSEIDRFRSPTMRQFMEPADRGLTIQVEIPVQAIDAEFKVKA